ncbi:hypothetical protein [Clostridium sp.]|uniref:hypothetical protein n=1 Tax=Clostridium sp. TaxID=1506 RepID=UPI0025C40228|nr:hypothetical protein [Clostridium sp.]
MVKIGAKGGFSYEKFEEKIFITCSLIFIIIFLFVIKTLTFYNRSLNYYLSNNLTAISAQCEYIDLNFPSDKNIERSKLESIFMAFQDVIKNYGDLSEIAYRANDEISLSYLSTLQSKFNSILNDKQNVYLSEEEINALNEIHEFCNNSKLQIDEYTKKYDNLVFRNRWIDLVKKTTKKN